MQVKQVWRVMLLGLRINKKKCLQFLLIISLIHVHLNWNLEHGYIMRTYISRNCGSNKIIFGRVIPLGRTIYNKTINYSFHSLSQLYMDILNDEIRIIITSWKYAGQVFIWYQSNNNWESSIGIWKISNNSQFLLLFKSYMDTSNRKLRYLIRIHSSSTSMAPVGYL